MSVTILSTNQRFVFIGTQAEIEALAGLEEGAQGYATDRSANEHEGVYNGASWEWSTYIPVSYVPDNKINNGGFSLFRRQAHTSPATLTAYADDVYCFDRWYVLTETASIQIAQTAGDNNRYACQMKQHQAAAQRFGLAQILPVDQSIGLRGQTVTFQIRAKSSATPALRVAILEWTGTADVVVSDIVNSWTNGTFTAGQFFKSTTMTVTAVSATANASGSFATFNVSGTISASCNNIIIFVWSENTAAQNVTVDVTKAGLFVGSAVLTWQEKTLREELADAMFYFRAWAEVSQVARLPFGSASSTTNCIVGITGPMRTTPTPTMAGTVQLFETQTGGVTAVTAITAAATDETYSSFNLAFTVAAGLTAGRSYFPILNAANSYVWLDAEL